MKNILKAFFAGTFLLSAAFAQQHNDPYTSGAPNENRLIKDIRH